MNPWARRTLELVTASNYLDQLQTIYSHEEGEREIAEEIVDAIREAYVERNETKLLTQLLDLEKFPYKDSYVGFLRKDRTAIERNPQTVRRICDRLYAMGLDNMINGVKQAKEANTRRGNQFGNWLKLQYPILPLSEFKDSSTGIVLLGGNELEAKDFCNRHLRVGITKRPDLVVKAGNKFVIGEAKFLSATGGNQGRAFDDGVKLATNTEGSAYKIFVLDGVLWIERGSEQYSRINHSTAAIFSSLLLHDFLEDLMNQ